SMSESLIRATVGRLGSWRAARSGDRAGRSLATKALEEGRADRRAVTRVNPEQASKVELSTPTQPEDGEGCTQREATDMRTAAVDRGNGDGTPGRRHGQRGRPALVRREPQRRLRRRPEIRVSGQESEGAIVPWKSGN